jgi:TPR repeat protein
MIYMNGDHVVSIKKDMNKALKLLHRAAELGSAQAYHSLGIMYYEGEGVSKIEKKNLTLLRKGCYCGCVASRTNVGAAAANGNFDRAIKHLLMQQALGISELSTI